MAWILPTSLAKNIVYVIAINQDTVLLVAFLAKRPCTILLGVQRWYNQHQIYSHMTRKENGDRSWQIKAGVYSSIPMPLSSTSYIEPRRQFVAAYHDTRLQQEVIQSREKCIDTFSSSLLYTALRSRRRFKQKRTGPSKSTFEF